MPPRGRTGSIAYMAKAWAVRLYVHGKKERGGLEDLLYIRRSWEKKFVSSLAAVISSIIRNGHLVLEEKQTS